MSHKIAKLARKQLKSVTDRTVELVATNKRIVTSKDGKRSWETFTVKHRLGTYKQLVNALKSKLQKGG